MDLFINKDTICAIATPVGEGGIGILKISGPEAARVARRLFRPGRPCTSFESHRLYHGWIHDPATGSPVDEVLLSFMAAPHTYTCEDVVEINCHSGYGVLNRLLELVTASGVRLAQPGEFTRRAFLGGRIDLSQAEAVAELIRSRSEAGLLLANRHLRGEFRETVEAWRDRLLGFLSELEAAIDFSDDLEGESLDPTPLNRSLEEALIEPLRHLISRSEGGQILREGFTLVLVGKPNVGKSSLLNALLGRDRAIVAPLPGTTRDVVEDSFLLSGIQVRILDTAGIRHEPDAVESLGIERTLRSVEEADAVLWLIDSSRPLSEEDETVFRSLRSTQRAILLNKSDLPAAVSRSEIEERFGTDAPILRLSALDPNDIDRLRELLATHFLSRPLEMSRSLLVPNLRHRECLARALEALVRARDQIGADGYRELASLDLQTARREFDAILGLECGDEVLDRIFSQFCIGK